jgi:hypothetical protein
MPEVDPGRIKGAAFREFVAYLEKEKGARYLAAVLEALPPEDRRQYLTGRPALGLLTATWYPAGLVHRFMDVVTAGTSAEERTSLARGGAEYAMGVNLRGVYRALFNIFASPKLYASSIQRMWDMHYDSGRVRIVEEAPRRHRSTIEDWRGHHPFICQVNSESSLATYAAMGCRQVRAEREACVALGGPTCVYLTVWSE